LEVCCTNEIYIEKTDKMTENILEILTDKYDIFVDTLFINGVTMIDLSNYVLRIRAETTPVMQWAGARAIRREVKEQLFEQGIEIPSPRLVVYSNKNEEKAE